MDAGVWNGHAYDDVPAITIVRWNRTPKPVRAMKVHATEVLMDHMCWQSPQARRRRDS